MNNDFHKTHDLFDLLKDLAVEHIDVEVEVPSTIATNGNGEHQNGHAPEHNNNISNGSS